MLEGLLRQTNTVQGVVVQWGIEQEVVVQWGTEQGVVVQWGTEQGVVLQEDKGLGVAECMRLGVAEGRMWDRGLGVAEGRTCDTGGRHIVQSGRQPLVEAHTYVEGGADSNIEVFGPWIAAWDRLHFVYLTQ